MIVKRNPHPHLGKDLETFKIESDPWQNVGQNDPAWTKHWQEHGGEILSKTRRMFNFSPRIAFKIFGKSDGFFTGRKRKTVYRFTGEFQSKTQDFILYTSIGGQGSVFELLAPYDTEFIIPIMYWLNDQYPC